jgi:hypothetical protein
MGAPIAAAFWGGVVRNQQVKAKEGTQTKIRAATSAYQQQKQDARNMNQAPNEDALNAARQQAVMRLQQGSGRASTFLSNGLGG